MESIIFGNSPCPLGLIRRGIIPSQQFLRSRNVWRNGLLRKHVLAGFQGRLDNFRLDENWQTDTRSLDDDGEIRMIKESTGLYTLR